MRTSDRHRFRVRTEPSAVIGFVRPTSMTTAAPIPPHRTFLPLTDSLRRSSDAPTARPDVYAHWHPRGAIDVRPFFLFLFFVIVVETSPTVRFRTSKTFVIVCITVNVWFFEQMRLKINDVPVVDNGPNLTELTVDKKKKKSRV